MLNDQRFREIATFLDRLVTVDYHTRLFIIDLYEEAILANGGSPLSYTAALNINEEVYKDSYVYLLVGFPTYGTFVAEQDGPVGGAVLSRTLAELKKCKIIVFTDESQKWLVHDTFRSAGFNIVEEPNQIIYYTQACIKGVDAMDSVDQSFIDVYPPSAIIAIERPSKNGNGKYMSMKGLDLSQKIAKLDEIVEDANRRNILTVGIADGGNEVGCGRISKAVERNHPNGKMIASSVSTRSLMFASTSNFGAYAIAGALAALNQDLHILVSPERINLILERSAHNGLHNGPPLWLDPGTDGVPAELESFIMSSIHRMIWEELNPHFPKFY